MCGGPLTFTPTTPASAVYTPYPDDLCHQVVLACATARTLINGCVTLASDRGTTTFDTAKFSSCTCDPQFLRMDYSCEYIGNKTCLATGATLSSVFGYYDCENFDEVIGTGLVSFLFCLFRFDVASV